METGEVKREASTSRPLSLELGELAVPRTASRSSARMSALPPGARLSLTTLAQNWLVSASAYEPTSALEHPEGIGSQARSAAPRSWAQLSALAVAGPLHPYVRTVARHRRRVRAAPQLGQAKPPERAVVEPTSAVEHVTEPKLAPVEPASNPRARVGAQWRARTPKRTARACFRATVAAAHVVNARTRSASRSSPHSS